MQPLSRVEASPERWRRSAEGNLFAAAILGAAALLGFAVAYATKAIGTLALATLLAALALFLHARFLDQRRAYWESHRPTPAPAERISYIDLEDE